MPASLFAAIVEENPIVPVEGDHSKFLVAFARDAENIAELAKSIPPTKLPDRFAIAHHAAYLYCPDGILQSATANALVGKAGRNVTIRNWATVLKLHKLLTKA